MKVLVYGDHKTHMACEAAAGHGHVRHAHNLDHAANELMTGAHEYLVVGGENEESSEMDARALESFAGRRPVILANTSPKEPGASVYADPIRNGAAAFAEDLARVLRRESGRQRAMAAVMSLRQLLAVVIH